MQRFASPEFALLVACCRWPQDAAAQRGIVARTGGIDWARFGRLTARHRVEGLAWRALQAAGGEPPEPVRTRLANAAGRIARDNLRSAAESVRLNRRFAEAGIAHLFVKGVTLGQLAYGDIVRKAGWDIDLLIAPSDLARAAAVLGGLGYAPETPVVKSSPERLTAWHRHSKESIWRNADRDVWLELHTALTDNPLLLPGVGVGSTEQPVAVSTGMTLPTLARDELFAYLCVHGASSVWFRLKWIADLAALVASEPADEVERLYRSALTLGAGRAAPLALLLAGLLFRSPMSTRLWRELRADPTNRWLVGLALRKLTGRTGEAELDDVVMGTASIHLAQLALLPGWRFQRAELARQLASPTDRVATPLPRGLTWLYPALQVIRVARERMAR